MIYEQPKIMLFTAEIAFRACLIELEKRGFLIKSLIPANMNRYLIVHGSDNIMITFKRSLFKNFYRLDSEDSKTVGDSINVNHLKQAIQNKVTKIYLILKNGFVYSIDIQDFLCKSIRWTNMEGEDIRSVSIHAYKKEFKL